MEQDIWQEQLTLASQKKRKGFGASAEQSGSFAIRVRVRVIWGISLVLVGFMVARILYIQVISRDQHILTSRENHVELKVTPALRGNIYDRRGVALTENQNRGGVVVRTYPLKEAIAPVTGYLSQVNPDEVGCVNGLCYRAGMLIGRSGLEQVFESYLRGRDGGRLVEVNASLTEVRELGSNNPESGQDIQLTIDAKLQEIMYRAFGGKKGSAVMIDIQGKVLGLVSSPSYDPNDVVPFLQDTKQLYFLNRAISGMYPPGSVFKLVTSYAGLSEGTMTGETKIEDTGEIKVGPYRYGNWFFDEYGKTEGPVDLVKAITRSNDIYFYKIGEDLGVDKLVTWARKFGLGSKTGIELPGEKLGLVPDRLFKERTTGEKWTLGNTYHLAIGQGDLTVTPLQIARMTAAAVSGRICQTSLLQSSEIVCQDLGLKTTDINLVRAGMKGACSSGGTAFPFFGFQPPVLCKTGTAQQGGSSDSDKSHAWITVAYPGDNPTMILTVMLEAAGEGSYEAGPVAKSILEQWRDSGN